MKKKKIASVLSAAVVSTAFIGSFASAADCTDIVINNSGNDATNTVECESVTITNVRCENNVIVANANIQFAESGDGEVDGNESTGSVKTGTAVNYNGTDTTVGATCDEQTSAASPTAVTPAGKGGGGAVAPVAAQAVPGSGAAAPAVLPYTASDSAATAVVASLVGAAAIAGGSRFVLAAYRRFGAK